MKKTIFCLFTLFFLNACQEIDSLINTSSSPSDDQAIDSRYQDNKTTNPSIPLHEQIRLNRLSNLQSVVSVENSQDNEISLEVQGQSPVVEESQTSVEPKELENIKLEVPIVFDKPAIRSVESNPALNAPDDTIGSIINQQSVVDQSDSLTPASAAEVKVTYCDTVDVYGSDLNQLSQTDKDCLAKSPVGFYYAKWLYNSKQLKAAKLFLEKFLTNFPAHKMALSLYGDFISPFSKVVAKVNQKLLNWYQFNSKIKPFSLQSPTKLVFPKPVIYKRDRFESIEKFNQRVFEGKKAYDSVVKELVQQYRYEVDKYNKKVRYYNLQVTSERQQQIESMNRLRDQYLTESIAEVLGSPIFMNMKYDIDSGVFFGYLGSTKSNLNEPVVIYSPPYIAQRVTNSIENLKPIIKFSIESSKLRMERLYANYGKYKFKVEIVSESDFPVFYDQSTLIGNENTDFINNARLINPDRTDLYGALEKSMIKIDQSLLEKKRFLKQP